MTPAKAAASPTVFPAVACKASDECHGAGQPRPRRRSKPAQRSRHPQQLRSRTKGQDCKKGFVNKHGKCVKKPKHHKHHKRADHHRGGSEARRIHSRSASDRRAKREPFVSNAPPRELLRRRHRSAATAACSSHLLSPPLRPLREEKHRPPSRPPWSKPTPRSAKSPRPASSRREPSGESFTIETSDGSTDTVEVSPSTTYSRARPVPGETDPDPRDVAPGDYVGVSGTLSGTTVTATNVVISTPQAGGHPDLTTSFALEDPGAPEAAQNVIFNAPTGVFGNPRAITQCAPADFALDQCPPDSQAGLITIHANYEGNPDKLLGTAPIFSIVPERRRNRPLLLHRPGPRHPDRDPRPGPHHHRLRPPLHRQRHHPAHPPGRRQDDLLGLPRRRKPRSPERFPKGTPGHPTGCPEEEGTACNHRHPPAPASPTSR